MCNFQSGKRPWIVSQKVTLCLGGYTRLKMELVAPSEMNMDASVKISMDSMTGITGHEIAFSNAYTGGNMMSPSECAPAANQHVGDDNACQEDLTALDHVVMGQADTVINDCAEQSGFKATVSIGVQVNLCCCANPTTGAIKEDIDINALTPAMDLKTETNDNNVKDHIGEDQPNSEQSEAVEAVPEGLLVIATEEVFLKHSPNKAKRKDKKRRKAEKASRKPKQQKVLTRRSTKSTLERRYLCEGCGIRFVHKATYDRHLLELRGKASEHKCANCDATFSFLCKLKQHFAAKHPELTSSPARERPVICHICGIQLQTSISMNKHMRIHDGDKPFLCKYCPKAFRWHTGLEYHERIHTGERPFKCPNCPKAFTSPSDMARHQTVHTGKKPHLCHQCGKGFTQSGTLSAHIKSKHMQLHNVASPLSRQTTDFCNTNSTDFKTETNDNNVKDHIGEDQSNSEQSEAVEADMVTISSDPKSADVHMCHLCGRYFLKERLLEAHIRKSHQQQLIPNSTLEGSMRCSTLENMKLQLA